MNTKYKLIKSDKKSWDGKALFQIEALRDIKRFSVKKGERGGYIEKKENLDVYGNAWVYGNARVYGDALVSGNARVYGDALVSGNARVYGDALVYGNAQVSGNARVYGDALVSGKLKLEAGFFFGVKWSGEVVQEIEIENGNYLIYKGDAKFGAEENEQKTELLKKADELIAKAEELKAEAEKLT